MDVLSFLHDLRPFVVIFIAVTAVLAGCFGITASHSQPIRASDAAALGVFVGSTPCGELPRQFLGIPANASCQRITWQLALLPEQNTRQPASYKLVMTYGMQAAGYPGFVNDGTTVESQGTWAIVKGTKTNPAAVVYQLNASTPPGAISLVKVNDNLLHFLQQDKSLMLGNPSWSYTLNRQGKES